MRRKLDVSRLDRYQLLQDFGVNAKDLEMNGDLERMLNHKLSSLITCYPVVGGVCFPMQCKLSLRLKSDGSLAVVTHPIRKEPNLTEYRGYMFTDEDRDNLLTTGNLGHTITIDSRIFGMSAEVYLTLDREINEFIIIPIDEQA